MAKLSVRHSIISIVGLFCLIFSGTAYSLQKPFCQQCSNRLQKINAIITNPRLATDNQLQEVFTFLCDGIPCPCGFEFIKTVETLFAGSSFKRIKKYFNDHPERLNEKNLWRLANFGQSVVNSFAPIITEHLDVIKNRLLILHMLPQDKIIKEQFIAAAVSNVGKLKSSILITIAGVDTGVLKCFMDAFDNCSCEQSVITLFALAVHAKKHGFTDLYEFGWKIVKQKLTSIFSNKSKAITFEFLLLAALYKYAYGKLPEGCSIPLQTAQHLFSLSDKLDGNQPNYYYYGTTAIDSLLQYASHERSKQVVNQIVALEQKFSDAGFYTFVHGQQWEYRLLEQWYTWLWEVEQNRSAGDYRFIHCRKLKKSNALEKQRQFRKKIIQDGRIELKERKRLLFLNAPFFGNINNQGSCTAYFAYNNSNINFLSFSLADIFKMFDCFDCYEKYRNELEALANEHKSLSKRGQVLLIAIPKKIIKECVYCAAPGGYKRKVSIDGKETDDIEVILEAFRTNASRIKDPDYMEFCLTLTDDMLTPDSGIKVRSLSMADDKRIQEFDAKARTLFDRMKNEIQAECKRANVIAHCVNYVDELCAQMKGQEVAAIKARVHNEALSDLSDNEKNIVKQRLLKRSTGLRQVCTTQGTFSKIMISPAGTFVMGISYGENALTVRNLLTGEDFIINHKFGLLQPYFIQYSPDERYLVFASNNILIIWDRITNKVDQIQGLNSEYFLCLDVSNNYVGVAVENCAQVQGRTYEIRVYDLVKHQFVQKIKDENKAYCSQLFLSADNKYLLSFSGYNYYVWEISSGKLQCSPTVNGAIDGLVQISTNKNCVVIYDGTIKILDMFTGKELKRFGLVTSTQQYGYGIQRKMTNDKKSIAYMSQCPSNRQIRIKNLESNDERVYKIKIDKSYFIVDFNEAFIITRNDTDTSITVWSYDNERSDLINQLFA